MSGCAGGRGGLTNDEAAVLEYARYGDFPDNSVAHAATIIDPTTGA